ncbi:DEAD-box ATP-dependent RNA helicase CshA-like [Macrobrachium nipponense]|uniref:DEAD-box ATP-dependent RNA helicase CshA-like n=1 Tax=Macrobrachium nipponense TaxID=159736 RepID=UPI0030C8B565
MATDLQENGTVKLNEEYLAELEAAAEGRYTESDEEFMKIFNSPSPKPPILPNNQFNRNRHGGRFRGNRNRGGYRDNWQDRQSDDGQGRRSDGWQDRRSDGWQDRRSDGWQDRRSDGWQDRRSDGWQDRRSDGFRGRSGHHGEGRHGGQRDERQGYWNSRNNKRSWDDDRR